MSDRFLAHSANNPSHIPGQLKHKCSQIDPERFLFPFETMQQDNINHL